MKDSPGLGELQPLEHKPYSKGPGRLGLSKGRIKMGPWKDRLPTIRNRNLGPRQVQVMIPKYY